MTPAPFRPRPGGPLPVWEEAGHRIKPVWIAAGGSKPSAALLIAARERAAVALADAHAEGGSSGLGFAILHGGEAGVWLLVRWWAHGDILCGRLFRAEDDAAPFAPVAPRPLLACVWELAVIEHERRAWIGAMMTDRPNPASYLARTFPEGAVA